MRPLIVLPQRQSEPVSINSVDLYAQALLARSCHQDYQILTHNSGRGFFGRDKIVPIPRMIENHALPTALFAAGLVRRIRPDIAIVHQRFQVAAALCKFCPALPVSYHSHSFHKGYADSERNRRERRPRELQRLAGMVHVSEACEADFTSKWADVRIPENHNSQRARFRCVVSQAPNEKTRSFVWVGLSPRRDFSKLLPRQVRR